MVSATGTNLSNLATCWDAKERAAALSMLQSGDPNLMIYIPTPDTEVSDQNGNQDDDTGVALALFYVYSYSPFY